MHRKTPFRFALPTMLVSGIVLLVTVNLRSQDSTPGLLQTFKGHEETVYAVALSPDGKLLLTGSFDRSVRLWDVATGKEIRTYAGHQNQVLCVTFAPDGLTFATSGSDNTAKIWDVPQRAPLRETILADAVTSAAISADGKLHAAAGKDGTIKVWNTADAKQSFDLKGHAGAVTAVAFSPNNQLLVSVGLDQTLRCWDPAKGQPIATVGAHSAAVTGLAIAANGSAAYTSSADGTIRAWQLPPAPARVIAGHGDAVACLELSNSGTVVTGSADKNIRVLSVENGQISKTFPAPAPVSAVLRTGNTIVAGTTTGEIVILDRGSGKVAYQAKAHTAAITNLSHNPQNGQVITSSSDGTVKTWVLTKNESKPVALPGKPHFVLLSPDGKQAVVIDADKSVKLRQIADGKEVRALGKLNAAPQAAAVSRDFALLAISDGKVVRVINIADSKEMAVLSHPADVLSISFDAEKKRVVTGAADNQARVWELPSGKLMQSVSHGGAVRTVAFHPSKPNQIIAGTADKNLTVHTLQHLRTMAISDKPIHCLTLMPSGSLLVGLDDGTAKSVNANNGQVERSYAGAKAPIVSAAISRNGNLVATGSADKSVRIYQASDAALVGAFQPGVVRSLQFHPNNTILSGAPDDKTVTFWSVAYQPGNPLPPEFGKPTQSLAHPAGVNAFILNNDATQLLSACDDKKAKVWKVASDAPVRNFQHPNLVDAIAYNKDGSLLATGGHDGSIRIFDTVKGNQVREIKAHVQPQPSPVYAVVWSADGKQIASGSMDRSAKLWDASNGNMIREFKGHDIKTSPKGHREAVFSVALSPDGKSMVTTSSDRGIKVWNTADGNVLREFVNPNLPQPKPMTAADPKQQPPPPSQSPFAHPGWIYLVRFAANGSQIVSVGSAPKNRGYLAVWNFADGKLLGAVELTAGPVYHAALTNDGNAAVLACGPRVRQKPVSDALLVKLPGR